MIWAHWEQRWSKALAACRRLGGDSRRLIVGSPATVLAVSAVERELALEIPTAFKEVLLHYAASVKFAWFLPNDMKLPEPLRGIFSGQCDWDLSRLIEIEYGRKQWVEVAFPNSENAYDRVWYDKLAFMEVGNGDLLALDLSLSPAPVVYLSHDGGEGHGWQLGRDFVDFIDRWTRLGCPGAEDWQMLPFLSGPHSYLAPDGANAKLWREVFGFSSDG